MPQVPPAVTNLATLAFVKIARDHWRKIVGMKLELVAARLNVRGMVEWVYCIVRTMTTALARGLHAQTAATSTNNRLALAWWHGGIRETPTLMCRRPILMLMCCGLDGENNELHNGGGAQ